MARLIAADEINAYVKQVTSSRKGLILLYKDARYDMAVLDEEYGQYNWQVSYEEVKGALYCTLSIWDAGKGCWVSKTSNGTESDMEAQKGEASDALKRAGFLWGIGRELYTAPTIFVSLRDDEIDEYNGKRRLKLGVTFHVSEIAFDDSRNITALTIVDGRGEQRFSWRSRTAKASAPKGFGSIPSEDGEGEPPSQFKPIRSFDPVKAKEHVTMKVGPERAKEIFASLGVKSIGDLKAMTEETYMKALSLAEDIYEMSVEGA